MLLGFQAPVELTAVQGWQWLSAGGAICQLPAVQFSTCQPNCQQRWQHCASDRHTIRPRDARIEAHDLFCRIEAQLNGNSILIDFPLVFQ